MNPLALLKGGSWALSLFGKAIPFPWLLSASLALLGAFLWHSNGSKEETIDKLRWQVASLEASLEASGARADQATEALRAVRKGSQSLQKANDDLRKEVALLRSKKASEAASGALQACQQSHTLIRESLYE